MICVSSHLTPDCKDQLDSWKSENKPKFNIRLWEKKDIEDRIFQNPKIMKKWFPKQYNNQVQANQYFKEANDVLERLIEDVDVVWAWADDANRALSDMIDFKPKVPTKRINITDTANALNEQQKDFLANFLQASEKMRDLFCKSFGLDHETVIPIILDWSEEKFKVVSIKTIDKVISKKERGIIQGILNNIKTSNEIETLKEKGMLVAKSIGAPFDNSDVVRFYIIDYAITTT